MHKQQKYLTRYPTLDDIYKKPSLSPLEMTDWSDLRLTLATSLTCARPQVKHSPKQFSHQ